MGVLEVAAGFSGLRSLAESIPYLKFFPNTFPRLPGTVSEGRDATYWCYVTETQPGEKTCVLVIGPD